jgi:hypothetical protein
VWNDDPTKLRRMKGLKVYFEDLKNWLPGVNAQLFWRYKVYLDRAEKICGDTVYAGVA